MYSDVLTALSNHLCVDTKEREDRRKILAHLKAPISCFGQDNEDAHLTGSAFVLDTEGRVLFTHHRKLNRWLQLGGHSDAHERCLSMTAFREASEESGLEDLIFHPKQSPRLLDVDVHLIPARKAKPQHYHLDFRYVFLTCTPDRIVVSSESHCLQWFSIKEAMDLDIYPALSRALRKLSRLV